ncbi:MAG: hypothetical protein LBR79_00920, partial [Oscillospiraceae bacterium]|nr:hypothetical protein [Oscillospiraceae bacterium]
QNDIENHFVKQQYLLNIIQSSNYSCYDLKQSSKVNLSVYSLPADGWEKVIKIRRFSNGTAILRIRQKRAKF